jgi:hypothetical protein
MSEATAVPDHKFGDYLSEPAKANLGRRAQTERQCVRCSVFKITIHLPDGGATRAWRFPGESFQSPCAPRCIALGDKR